MIQYQLSSKHALTKKIGHYMNIIHHRQTSTLYRASYIVCIIHLWMMYQMHMN